MIEQAALEQRVDELICALALKGLGKDLLKAAAIDRCSRKSFELRALDHPFDSPALELQADAHGERGDVGHGPQCRPCYTRSDVDDVQQAFAGSRTMIGMGCMKCSWPSWSAPMPRAQLKARSVPGSSPVSHDARER